MNPCFQRLSPMAGPPRRFQAGQFIYHQGDRVEALHLLRWGTVKIARLSPHGHETTVSHLGDGECFGEVELLIDAPERGCLAQATSDVVVSSIPVGLLGPEHRLLLQGVALARLYQAQLCLADMLAQPPAVRVASLLRYLAAHGSTIRLSFEEIGMTTDCPRDLVSRALRRLALSGALTIKRGVIQVLDPRLLDPSRLDPQAPSASTSPHLAER